MILDEIRSEYLAIRFQSKFAHSSGFLINRYQKLRQNSIRRLTMLGSLLLSIVFKIWKVVTSKAKYYVHNTSRTNQHLKIIFTGQKSAQKYGKFWEVFISHRMVFGNHSVTHMRARSVPLSLKRPLLFKSVRH